MEKRITPLETQKWQEGKLDESLDYFTRFLDIGKSLDEKWSMAAAMNNISLIHQRRDEYSEAIDILNQASGNYERT